MHSKTFLFVFCIGFCYIDKGLCFTEILRNVKSTLFNNQGQQHPYQNYYAYSASQQSPQLNTNAYTFDIKQGPDNGVNEKEFTRSYYTNLEGNGNLYKNPGSYKSYYLYDLPNEDAVINAYVNNLENTEHKLKVQNYVQDNQNQNIKEAQDNLALVQNYANQGYVQDGFTYNKQGFTNSHNLQNQGLYKEKDLSVTGIDVTQAKLSEYTDNSEILKHPYANNYVYPKYATQQGFNSNQEVSGSGIQYAHQNWWQQGQNYAKPFVKPVTTSATNLNQNQVTGYQNYQYQGKASDVELLPATDVEVVKAELVQYDASPLYPAPNNGLGSLQYTARNIQEKIDNDENRANFNYIHKVSTPGCDYHQPVSNNHYDASLVQASKTLVPEVKQTYAGYYPYQGQGQTNSFYHHQHVPTWNYFRQPQYMNPFLILCCSQPTFNQPGYNNEGYYYPRPDINFPTPQGNRPPPDVTPEVQTYLKTQYYNPGLNPYQQNPNNNYFNLLGQIANNGSVVQSDALPGLAKANLTESTLASANYSNLDPSLIRSAAPAGVVRDFSSTGFTTIRPSSLPIINADVSGTEKSVVGLNSGERYYKDNKYY
uniref:Putative secreted protein n=1 Tax=Xenopsylla cheopis TaxID=163159 RepID=A0A6M2DZP2_XENCH